MASTVPFYTCESMHTYTYHEAGRVFSIWLPLRVPESEGPGSQQEVQKAPLLPTFIRTVIRAQSSRGLDLGVPGPTLRVQCSFRWVNCGGTCIPFGGSFTLTGCVTFGKLLNFAVLWFCCQQNGPNTNNHVRRLLLRI